MSFHCFNFLQISGIWLYWQTTDSYNHFSVANLWQQVLVEVCKKIEVSHRQLRREASLNRLVRQVELFLILCKK